MILHNLTHRNKESVFVYTDSLNFVAYVYDDIKKRYYEYYKPHNIASSWSESTDSAWINASTYKRKNATIDYGYLKCTEIKLSDKPKTYAFKFGEHIDTITVGSSINKSSITSVKRIDNNLYISVSKFGTIMISTSVDHNDPPLIKYEGIDVSYIIPNKYINYKLFVHYSIDDIHIQTSTSDPLSIKTIRSPEKPSLLMSNDHIRVSWTSPNPFDFYNVLKRREGGPWVSIADIVNSSPVQDYGIDSAPSGGCWYRIVGIIDNKSYIGPESYVYVPGSDFFSLKPHGRATTNYDMVSRWHGPVSIGC